MYSQTNVQLFDQLQREGYSPIDLRSIVNAYRLAMQLFTGLYRPSGEPFIVHQVGTASILGTLRLPADVVAAGLIHAAYTHGDFGTLGTGISRTKRARIKLAVGDKVEDYVARYTALGWKPRNILAAHRYVGTVDPTDRHVIVMRLADVLEKYQDREILYCRDLKKVRNYLHLYADVMIDTAKQARLPGLAAELKTAFDQIVSATTASPIELHNVTGRSFTDCIAPQSYRRSLRIRLYRSVKKCVDSARPRLRPIRKSCELIRSRIHWRSVLGVRRRQA